MANVSSSKSFLPRPHPHHSPLNLSASTANSPVKSPSSKCLNNLIYKTVTNNPVLHSLPSNRSSPPLLLIWEGEILRSLRHFFILFCAVEIFIMRKSLIPSLQKRIPPTSQQRLKEPGIGIAADTQKAISYNHCDRSV